MVQGNPFRLALCRLRTVCLMCYLFVHCNGRHLENPKSTLMHLLWTSCYYVISVDICVVLIPFCLPHRNKVCALKSLQINVSTELSSLVDYKLQGQALKKSNKVMWGNVPNGVQWNCMVAAIKLLIWQFCYFCIDFRITLCSLDADIASITSQNETIVVDCGRQGQVKVSCRQIHIKKRKNATTATSFLGYRT